MKHFSKNLLAIGILVILVIVSVFVHFWQTSSNNHNVSTSSLSEKSKSSGIIEATQEKVNAILSDAEVQKTLKRIENSDEYYNKDGAIFLNKEKHLPTKKDRQYYVEWTVKTPGEKTRGTKRIVVGKGGEMYFTDDHYNTFIKIR